ncbi:dehydrogenase E1 component subunit alpha/beta [Hymenobacter sp. BT770]|uniref:alpha-ketoacid dehydrogenase subunit alpha/beta n=1 Tax=Hymenobacter sp. BT770 TaxID=2886942 RepID=UPI001D10A1BB|nr:dehydrogenase E1 component subunit alpha/beta [Hymenobacter sp. BT770]MCC3151869.1 dehydrogenase E1 component subunit alpha/beta [Hymenobacter sp. BT770]MDO3413509.1 dehydrogenase E1 component subunit alpha/beta [Hymenobacter sp. BT770]
MMTLAATALRFDRLDHSNETLLHLYQHLLRPRLIEEKMLILLRQGKVSKWFSGIGQEAISVGSTLALEPDEYILPLHRNLGVFTGRNVPLGRLFAQWQGKRTGFTKGRDRSFHFGSNEHHIVGMISHLGPQLAVADGIALADVLDQKPKVTLTYSGDGGASEGDFHEALNVAAVWQLPVIFMIENNGYGLSTPSNEQFRFKSFVDKGPAYGMDAVQVDGNNVLEVYSTVKRLAEDLRQNPRPVLIEALTFRMRGHEEASGTKYVPQSLMEEWAAKDPVENYEKWLIQEGILTETAKHNIRETIKAAIEAGLQEADAVPMPTADVQEEIADMYQPFTPDASLNEELRMKNEELKNDSPNNSSLPTRELRFVDAIQEGLRQSMQRYPDLVLMGQDIADYGGVFKITEGFVAEFGKARVRNTPLCESAIVGAGLGLSIKGKKSMVEMQFADFVTCGFNQIVNNLAKSHYRWGQNADVVVRMPTGAGSAAGPFHSQSNEAWFTHVPGLKVVYPSNPHDAKGLLCAAFEDPNPVMYFEHKMLYRSLSGPVPEAYYTTPIGKAALAAEGNELSIITYGMGVRWALQVCEELNVSADILDLRTLLPWDQEAVRQTVEKNGRVLVLHEDTLTGGIGGEIAAWIGENCFEHLDAPVRRVASLDTAIPFAPPLEAAFLPLQRLREQVEALRSY